MTVVLTVAPARLLMISTVLARMGVEGAPFPKIELGVLPIVTSPEIVRVKVPVPVTGERYTNPLSSVKLLMVIELCPKWSGLWYVSDVDGNNTSSVRLLALLTATFPNVTVPEPLTAWVLLLPAKRTVLLLFALNVPFIVKFPLTTVVKEAGSNSVLLVLTVMLWNVGVAVPLNVCEELPAKVTVLVPAFSVPSILKWLFAVRALAVLESVNVPPEAMAILSFTVQEPVFEPKFTVP